MGQVNIVIFFLKQRKKILDEYLSDVYHNKMNIKDMYIDIYTEEVKQIEFAIKKLSN